MCKRVFSHPYFVAAAASAAAMALRQAVEPWVGETHFFLAFVLAVIVSAWYGGSRPAIVATVLGAIFNVLPDSRGPFQALLNDGSVVLRFILYLVTCAVSMTLIQEMHEANRRLAAALESADEENRQRLKAEEALRLVNRRQEEFMGLLAHEIRNPLGALQNVFTLIVSQPGREDRLRRSVEIGRRQIDLLQRLTNDLLDTARIAHGTLELRPESIDLTVFARDLAEAHSARIAERRQHLRLDFPDRLRLRADPARLEQVLSNLLTNAIKHTSEDGRIEIRCKRDGAVALLQVCDDGDGIEPELLPRVFDCYVGGAAPRAGGLGLGLALVRSLVELHGGRVEAASAGRGRGATFTLYLPIAPEENPD